MLSQSLTRLVHLLLVVSMVFSLLPPAVASAGYPPPLPQSGLRILASPPAREAASAWQGALAQEAISCDVAPPQFPEREIEIYLPVLFKAPGGARSSETLVRSAAPAQLVTTAEVLPPDPRDTADNLDRTVATNIYTATRFLYTGDNPIQIQVQANAINPRRVGVLRGITLDSKGDPLPGVTVSILDHPEYGCTLSRADGRFDLVVNGGGQLTVSYRKTNYLASQRQVRVPLLDYVWLEEVALLPYDGKATTIDTIATEPFQVAQGNVVNDEDGTRQATLLFPQGTTASMTMPDGQLQAMSSESFTVRATEYTVGETGDEAMPGELPAQSGYTYAVDFSIDEAVTSGATRVDFDQAVIFYVENFLDFPVGMAVPTGYYDQTQGKWIASDNGQIIKILAISNGLAEVDSTGDDAADNGAALGMTEAERQRLAGLYSAGQSLWRVGITHFTPWDCNWPVTPPANAEPPPVPSPVPTPPIDEAPNKCGSTIGIHNQSLGEQVEIVGTPYRLHYQSNRAAGNKDAYTIKIPLSTTTLPSSVKEIVLEIEVAGQQLTQSFAPTPNQGYTFTWDGKDDYGRLLQGSQPISIRVGYVYDAEYQEPAQFDQAFAAFSGIPITGSRAREEITLWQEWKSKIGVWDRAAQKLGGWSLNIHHVYDPGSQTLYLGDGRQRSTEVMGQVISTVAGNGETGVSGDGGPAIEAEVNPRDVVIGPDGSLYIASTRVRRVDPEGIITTFAGGGDPPDDLGDGGPATQARLRGATRLALGPDGSLYISESLFSINRVRKVDPNGVITTVAGGSTAGYSGDGGPATQAQINNPAGLAVGPDGSLYIAEDGNHVIRRVGPDGIITTVAGDGTRCPSLNPCGDGGPANQAKLFSPEGVAIAPDGTLYLTQYDGYLRYVGADGIIRTLKEVAGTWQGQGIAFGPDGSLYISYYRGTNGYVFRVEDDGSLVTVAGNGGSGFYGDGGSATQAPLKAPQGIDIGPDGSIYISDWLNYRVRKVGPALVGFSTEEIGIPSQDGSMFYVFDGVGRHLRTLNALTGATVYSFSYNGAGLLVRVEDGDGNITTIERNAAGNPTAIVGPYGQRTTLAVNSDDYLASITNPAGESHQFGYTNDGLLLDMSDPRNQLYQFTYDALGRLLQDSDPAGGAQSLARTELGDGFIVDHTTALNRDTEYQVQSLAGGDQNWITTDPDGTQTEQAISYRRANRSTTYADGMVTTRQDGADPRFGMEAVLPIEETVSTPGGLTFNSTTERTASLTNEQNPLSLISLNETVTVNGRQFTSAYDAAARQFTFTTPEGRQSTTTIDPQGRMVQDVVPGFDAVNYTYDNRGRLATITQGTGADARTLTLNYNNSGYLATLTDSLNRTTSFSYDAAGRVTSQTLPDNRTISYGYDANGNLTSLTPPGKQAHTFSYTPVNLVASYTPPDVGIGATQTQYSYNLDRQLTKITRPDSQTLDFAYDGAGRLSSLTLPRGSISYTYDIATGNLASIAAPDGLSLSYSYDGALVTGETLAGPVAGSVSYIYDNNFNLTSQSVNGGQPVTFQYDDDDWLIQAGNLSLSRDTQNGLLTGSTLGNVTTGLSYNSFGELATYQADYNATTLYDVQYSHDQLGRITQKIESIQGSSTTYDYSYDPAGRLAEVKQNNVTVETYTYDTNGNRLTGPGVTTTNYDNQDRLLQYGSTTYSYSANGELQNKTDGGQTTTYDYDVIGNLLGVTLPNNTQIDYLIDGENRRVGKKVNGTLVQGFLYEDALNPVAELDGSNTIVSRFVYAGRINVPDYMIRGGVTYRLISDHLGSVRLVVNTQNGSVVQRLDYDAFGNVLQDTNPGFQPFGFAGGLYDPDTGLVRFGARDYDAEVGRWTAKDPIGFAGGDANLYAYVGGEPVNHIDVTGYWVNLVFGVVLWGARAATAAGVRGGIGRLAGALSRVASLFPRGFPRFPEHHCLKNPDDCFEEPPDDLPEEECEDQPSDPPKWDKPWHHPEYWNGDSYDPFEKNTLPQRPTPILYDSITGFA